MPLSHTGLLKTSDLHTMTLPYANPSLNITTSDTLYVWGGVPPGPDGSQWRLESEREDKPGVSSMDLWSLHDEPLSLSWVPQ